MNAIHIGGRKKLKDSRSKRMQWPRGRAALEETFETDKAEIRGGKAVSRRGGRCEYVVLARVHVMGSPLRTSTGPFSLLAKSMRSALVIVPARATCASGRPYGHANAMQCSESSSLDSNLSFLSASVSAPLLPSVLHFLP